MCRGLFSEAFQSFLEIFDDNDLVAFIRKEFLRYTAQRLLILDDQNRLLSAWRDSFLGRNNRLVNFFLGGRILRITATEGEGHSRKWNYGCDYGAMILQCQKGQIDLIQSCEIHLFF